MLVQGIFFHEWDPSRVPKKMNWGQFLDRVAQEFPYEIESSLPRLVKTVLQALRPYVAEGEWDDIRASVSKDLGLVLP